MFSLSVTSPEKRAVVKLWLPTKWCSDKPVLGVHRCPSTDFFRSNVGTGLTFFHYVQHNCTNSGGSTSNVTNQSACGGIGTYPAVQVVGHVHPKGGQRTVRALRANIQPRTLSCRCGGTGSCPATGVVEQINPSGGALGSVRAACKYLA